MQLHPARVVLGAAIAIMSSLGVLLLGGTVAMCLGPLDVTAVRCAASTGMLPTEGPAPAMLITSIALGVLVAFAEPRLARSDAVAVACGAASGAALYLLRRPTALEGPDYDGTWLSIPLPMEPVTVAAWAIAGLLVALTTVGMLRAARDRHR
jgi:hypothetical protein